MTTYAKAVRTLLRQGTGIDELNAANHLALERQEITLEEFLEAARILAAELLKR